jgi:CRISPR-associated protein Cas2
VEEPLAHAPHLYLVAYDIADPARLRAVHRVVRGFGDPVQKSVFRCELSDRQRAVLRDRLIALVKHDEDQVIILDTGPVSSERSWRVETIGLPSLHPDSAALVY